MESANTVSTVEDKIVKIGGWGAGRYSGAFGRGVASDVRAVGSHGH